MGHNTSDCAGRSGEERSYDTIALYQRADSRLCALLYIGCHILLSIAIDVGPQVILKTGLGGRRALRLQLFEEDEHFPTAVQCCISSIRDKLHIPFSSGAINVFFSAGSQHMLSSEANSADHEPGVLERRSSEPKTSCEGADMVIECGSQRDEIGSRVYLRKTDCCNLYATRPPFCGDSPSPVFNLPWVSFSGYIQPEPFSRFTPGPLSTSSVDPPYRL